MLTYNLSALAIRSFSWAVERADLKFIQDLFADLDKPQKRGLLNLTIDFQKITGDSNARLAVGNPLAIAKFRLNSDLWDFLIKQSRELGLADSDNEVSLISKKDMSWGL